MTAKQKLENDLAAALKNVKNAPPPVPEQIANAITQSVDDYVVLKLQELGLL